MKKNKLTLAAGILMIVVASLSILAAIDYTVVFVEISSSVYAAEGGIPVSDIGLLLAIVSYLGLAIISVAEAILYMIWGVKLLRKTKKHFPVSKMRGFITTMTVFSYVLAFIHMGDMSASFALFLAIAILLTVSLSKENEHQTVSNESVLDKDSIEKMIAIKKLYDDKIVDEEEYNKLRDKILNDIVNLDK